MIEEEFVEAVLKIGEQFRVHPELNRFGSPKSCPSDAIRDAEHLESEQKKLELSVTQLWQVRSGHYGNSQMI